jgi:DNA repair photolyase
VNPIVPGVTSHDQVEELFGLLAEAGANHVIVKFVEAGFSWAPSMIERIGKRFGKERGLAFASPLPRQHRWPANDLGGVSAGRSSTLREARDGAGTHLRNLL